MVRPGGQRPGVVLITFGAVVLQHCVRAQFGGGGGGYKPPPPICRPFTCPDGEKAVAKPDYQIWSYGCKDSGMNILSTANFDPSNPFAGAQQKNLDKCCVERDICKQTCGMTSKACHESFQKCSGKICKGDQNCELQAMMSDIMSEPYDPEESKKPDYKYDPEEAKCKGYKKGQADSCMCVPKKKFKGSVETKLKSFYGKFNPEKLDKKGEIKDVDEVWKKWKDKEPEMFTALATKYKDKAVEIRVKPKPPPYTPPKEDERDSAAESGDYNEDYASPSSNEESSSEEPTSASTAEHSEDPDAVTFADKKAELIAKKKKAAQDEDYDLAEQVKQEVIDLTKGEISRLKALKAKAIEDEDYKGAKRIKTQLAKLEEL